MLTLRSAAKRTAGETCFVCNDSTSNAAAAATIGTDVVPNQSDPLPRAASNIATERGVV